MYLYILTKYGLVYILGDFFHKLIWSAFQKSRIDPVCVERCPTMSDGVVRHTNNLLCKHPQKGPTQKVGKSY
jgi:hypothetical protein